MTAFLNGKTTLLIYNLTQNNGDITTFMGLTNLDHNIEVGRCH